MTTALQRRRGTTAQHAAFIGLLGETTIDTDKKTVVVHDGSTAGGVPLAKEADLAGKAPTSHTHTASQISDASAAGRSVLTAADIAAITALLNAFTSGLKGLVPASGGGTTNFLRADGTFAAPAGGGDLLAANNLSDLANIATALNNLGLGTGNSPQFTGVNVGHASDTTITRTGAGTIAVEGVGVALNSASLPHTASQFEVGNASDTTITRSAAGQIAVEGKRILNDGDKGILGCVLDGGGAVLTTGVKGEIGPMTFAGTIEMATLLADQSGSIVIDIWKDSYANYPPTIADTITAAAKPTLSAAVKSQDATLTGWTVSFAVGDIFRINVDSVATIQRATLVLQYKRT